MKYITLLLIITLPKTMYGMDFSKMSQQEKNVRLLEATSKNDCDRVALLIKNNADVNTKDLLSNTALMHAAYHGFLSLAQLLVEAKADVTHHNRMRETALHFAASTKHYDDDDLAMIQFLLNAKADVNHLDYLNTSVLYEAVKHQRASLTECLIQKKADVNATHWFGKSILMEAAQGTSTKIVLDLLHAKADINYTSKEYGHTALILARWAERSAIVELLLEHKANA